MHETRSDVIRWVETGALPPARARAALVALGAVPTPVAWRIFLERVLLWLGLIALSAALGFFIAANWQALGRFGKLALVEAAIVAAIAVASWRGYDSAWGRASLLVAALAVGTLLALVGQTYQTGADSWELFAAWAVAILPWVVVGRQPALWMLWIALLDVAVWLYAVTMLDWIGIAMGDRGALWAILGIHVVALLAWEAATERRITWLDVNWARRLLAVGAGVAVTVLALDAVLADRRGEPRWAAVVAYAGFVAAIYYGYRMRRRDLFVLACGVLSVIVVLVAVIVRWGRFEGAAGLLAIAVVIVTLATAGAGWLRRVAHEGAR